MELAQIRLIVDDFAKCFRFYRDVLQLKPQFDDDRGPYGKFSLGAGSAAIALHAREDLVRTLPTLSAGSADRALVVIKVENVEQTVAHLKSRGVIPEREPAVAWGRLRVAYLRDPEGNIIELQQWLVAA